MQPNLLGLEITKGELRRLTGSDPDNVIRKSIFQNRKKRLNFLLNEILVCFALSSLIVGIIYIFIILPTIGSSSQIAVTLLIAVPIVIAAGRWMWRQKTCPPMLTTLLDTVDKYHAVINEINISAQLETFETKGMSLSDRTLVVDALQLTREDLVRALRAERVFRKNKDVIATTPELSTNNLRALRAMQANNQASEYGRVLHEVLQICLSVQEEMRRLQGQRSS